MVQVPVLPLPRAWGEFTHGNLLRRIRREPDEGHSRAAAVARLSALLGRGDRASTATPWTVWDGNAAAWFSTPKVSPKITRRALPTRDGLPPGVSADRLEAAGPVATREYFPSRFRAAVRQRSRWVAGIALQGWERHGWQRVAAPAYWLWRDRKGLAGNLLSPAANLLFLYGCATYAVAAWSGQRWGLASHVPPPLAAVYSATLLISLVQMGMKMRSSARVYGWRFAAGVPLRMPWANLVTARPPPRP